VRNSRVATRFLVPATPEPSIACVLDGVAQFEERELDGSWVKQQIQRGDIFITRSQVPYELRWRSPVGQEIEVIATHVALKPFLPALHAANPGREGDVDVIDFFGRDEALAFLCYSCGE